MTDREIFRKNLTNLMNETKTKNIDIANYAKVSYQAVSAWVTGRGYPRADAMEKLCKFFNIKQSALTEEHEETEDDRLLFLFHAISDEGREKLIERANELAKLYPMRKKKNGKTEAEQ